MDWLQENWFWVAILALFVWMHSGGHGHGCHGGGHEHGGHDGHRDRSDPGTGRNSSY